MNCAAARAANKNGCLEPLAIRTRAALAACNRVVAFARGLRHSNGYIGSVMRHSPTTVREMSAAPAVARRTVHFFALDHINGGGTPRANLLVLAATCTPCG